MSRDKTRQGKTRQGRTKSCRANIATLRQINHISNKKGRTQGDPTTNTTTDTNRTTKVTSNTATTTTTTTTITITTRTHPQQWSLREAGCSLYIVPVGSLGTDEIPPVWYIVRLLRGTLVNRTYGTHKNLYIYLFLLTLLGPIYYGPP